LLSLGDTLYDTPRPRDDRRINLPAFHKPALIEGWGPSSKAPRFMNTPRMR
jgi:hypothetical protein